VERQEAALAFDAPALIPRQSGLNQRMPSFKSPDFMGKNSENSYCQGGSFILLIARTAPVLVLGQTVFAL
jgi:hypothetical protein